MAATRKDSPEPSRKRRPPATTPEARQNQMIALSYDAAEEMIRSGKATSQLLTHFLKLGTAREMYELQKLEQEAALLKQKREMMESQKQADEMYAKALNAMRAYQGIEDSVIDYEE